MPADHGPGSSRSSLTTRRPTLAKGGEPRQADAAGRRRRDRRPRTRDERQGTRDDRQPPIDLPNHFHPKTLVNGTRVAPLVEIAPGLIAFGPNRVDALLETPVEGFTFLRGTVPLIPGRYTLSAGRRRALDSRSAP